MIETLRAKAHCKQNLLLQRKFKTKSTVFANMLRAILHIIYIEQCIGHVNVNVYHIHEHVYGFFVLCLDFKRQSPNTFE